MKIYFDTEFIEDGRTIDLLSIGMVREDGVELYLENLDADLSRASDWVQANVIPHLDWWRHGGTRKSIASVVRDFVGPDPEFWAYYADYDWVALCQLYGTMMDLPEGWPKYCLDLQQERLRKRITDLPPMRGKAHRAIDDAVWLKTACEFVAHRAES